MVAKEREGKSTGNCLEVDGTAVSVNFSNFGDNFSYKLFESGPLCVTVTYIVHC